MLPHSSIHNFYQGYDKSKFDNLNGDSLNQAPNQLLANDIYLNQQSDLNKSNTATLTNTVNGFASSISTANSNSLIAKDKADLVLSVNEKSWLANASTGEGNSEILRMMGASGIFSVRQYTYDTAFNPSKRPFEINYASIGQHDHANYEGMAGSAEYSAIANGYYVRSRHNDYRFRSPANSPASYLATQTNSTPPVPTSVLSLPSGCNIDGTVDVINNTQAKYIKNVKTNNPQDCTWEMSYMEVWLEAFTSTLDDPFDSFRHSIDANTIEEALNKALYLNAGGHKNRLENIPYFPTVVRTVDINGLPIMATVKYRVLTQKVATLAEVPYNETESINGTTNSNSFKLLKDLQTKHHYNYTNWTDLSKSRRARFEMKDGLLQSLCEKIYGMDGMGSYSNESYDQYGLEDNLTEYGTSTLLNASKYTHAYSMVDDDASGRNNAHRGFNDPNLFVAKTKHSKVIDGFTYLIPLEMVLRTPAETWNPYNIPSVAVTGGGILVTDPLSGWNLNLYNFKIPSAVHTATGLPSDSADTYKSAFVRTPAHGIQNVRASGINVHDYDGYRRRFPIFASFHDFNKGNAEVLAMKTEMKLVLKEILAGTLTNDDIDKAF